MPEFPASTAPGGRHPTFAMVALLGALTAFGAISIDMYLPAMPGIGRTLGASAADVQRTLSSLFAGLAIGQFVYGPLSDRIGRRPPILAGIMLYIAASAACALASDVAMLIVARFFQGFGACSALVVSRAVVRDRYDHQDSARIFSLIMLVFGVVPIVAPLLGGFVLTVGDWRTIFWILTGFGVAVGVAVLVGLPESRTAATAARAATESAVAAYFALLRDRRLVGYVLCGAFNSACLFLYLAISPDLIIGGYGVSPQHFGWIFGLNAAGLIAGSQVNRWLLDRYDADRILVWATLACVVWAALLGLAALTGFGGMIGVLVPLFFILSTFGFMGGNTSAGALSVDPTRAGSIASLSGIASFGLGAVATGLAGGLYDGTALPLALAMMAALVASAAALFFLAMPGRAAAV